MAKVNDSVGSLVVKVASMICALVAGFMVFTNQVVEYFGDTSGEYSWLKVFFDSAHSSGNWFSFAGYMLFFVAILVILVNLLILEPSGLGKIGYFTSALILFVATLLVFLTSVIWVGMNGMYGDYYLTFGPIFAGCLGGLTVLLNVFAGLKA